MQNLENRADLTVNEMARLLNVHRTSVLRWLEVGKLQAFRLAAGRSYRIPASELDRIRQPISVDGHCGD